MPKDSFQTERNSKRNPPPSKERKRTLQDERNLPPSKQTAKMNASIVSSKKNAYHIFTNVEFSGVVDITHLEYDYIYDYHLFIRYGDKVYMEVKGIGDVVITFEELQKNKYWKYYYDLSLMLTDDKHLAVNELRFSSEYCDYILYDTARYWWIDTSYIVDDMKSKKLHRYGDKGVRDTYDKTAYYKINPYDLEKMDYTSLEDLEVFRANYMSSSIVEEFEMKCVAYDNLVSERQTKEAE